ncbi:hypothetical protein BC830DRAFT_473954 [Chytriomyces sp. MP71]|nr:hypothetical protein BC830DRAFT_473954 [Chytriomyces sp. MP71]
MSDPLGTPPYATRRRTANKDVKARPISLFGASPLRSSTQLPRDDDANSSKRRASVTMLSDVGFKQITSKSTSRESHSSDHKEKDSIESGKVNRTSSVKSAMSQTAKSIHNTPDDGSISDSQASHRPSLTKNSLSFGNILLGTMLAKKKSLNRKESHVVFPRISESRELGVLSFDTGGSEVSDGNSHFGLVEDAVKLVFRVVNSGLDEISPSASFDSNINEPETTQGEVPKISILRSLACRTGDFYQKINPSTYKTSRKGSVSQILNIELLPDCCEGDLDAVEFDDENQKKPLAATKSMDMDLDGHSEISNMDKRRSIGDIPKRDLTVSRTNTTKTHTTDIFRPDSNSEVNVNLERKLTDKSKKGAAMKVIDTIKANNTKKGLGWGEMMLINGALQSILSGSLECYIFWAVWKFLYVSYGNESGSAQFILAYCGLFILAEIFMLLGLLDAAWNKNSMQVIACMIFNLAILSYSFVQLNYISQRIRFCATSFIEVYQDGGYPFIVNNSTLVESNQQASFNLVGACPWSLQQNMPQLLTMNLSLLNRSAPIELIIVGVSGLGNLLGLFFGFKTYQEYGWSLYQVQGASIKRKWIITRYHLFILLLKLNIYFTLGFVAQMVAAFYYSEKGITDREALLARPWILGPTNETTIIQPLTHPYKEPNNILLPSSIAAIFAAIISYVLGWNAIRRCSRNLMFCFLVLVFGDFLAAIYGLIAMYSDTKYEITRTPLAMFCMIQIAVNIVTWIVGYMNILDFKRGLKDLLMMSANQEIGFKKERRIMLD